MEIQLCNKKEDQEEIQIFPLRQNKLQSPV